MGRGLFQSWKVMTVRYASAKCLDRVEPWTSFWTSLLAGLNPGEYLCCFTFWRPLSRWGGQSPPTFSPVWSGVNANRVNFVCKCKNGANALSSQFPGYQLLQLAQNWKDIQFKEEGSGSQDKTACLLWVRITCNEERKGQSSDISNIMNGILLLIPGST